MENFKSLFASKTVLTGLAIAIASALGLADVINAETVNAATLVGAALVVVFRRLATAKIA